MPYNKKVSHAWGLMTLKTYNLFSNLFQNFQLRTTVFQTIFCMRSNPSAILLLSMLTNSFEATPPLYLLPLNNGLSSTYKARYTIPLLLFSYKGMAQHSLQWIFPSSNFLQSSFCTALLLVPGHRYTFSNYSSHPSQHHSYQEYTACNFLHQALSTWRPFQHILF